MSKLELVSQTPFEPFVCEPLSVSRNETYLMQEGDVLHLSLDLPEAASPSEAMLSERYFPRNKGQRLSRYVLSIPPYSDQILCPEITEFGTIDTAPHTISYWREPLVPGVTAEALGDEFNTADYAKIVDWISELQARCNTSDVSVAEYYDFRCAASEELLRNTLLVKEIAPEQRQVLCRAIQLCKQLVDDLKLPEPCVMIHGDLHGGNVLKSLSNKPDGLPSFAIIDFEFGIDGPGDTLIDIQKLLRLDNNLLGQFSSDCRPPITLSDKNMLVRTYLERFPESSGIADEMGLRKRVVVMMLDAFITRIIGFEIYKEKVGDIFPIPDYEQYTEQAFVKLADLCKDAESCLS